MLKSSRDLKLSIVLLVVGFLVHFTGFVSPYWNILPNEKLNNGTETIIRIGLWKICHRMGTTNKCVEYNEPPSQIEAVRLFETLTVILYCLSLLMFWLYRRHPVYGSSILVACMVFIILIVESTAIGGLLWVTVKKIQQKHTLSWAFGLTVASVVFPVIAGWFVSNERNSFVQQQRRNSSEMSEKILHL